MSEPSFQYDDVDAFTTGAVGQPGGRTFYLQIRRGPATVALKCEKQQVAALAQYFEELLTDVASPGEPAVTEAMRFVEPVLPAWTVGPIGVAYESSVDRVVVALEEIVSVDEDGNPDPAELEARAIGRVLLTRSQVSAFIDHARAVVAGGRPTCRFCGRPINPDGHMCPRMN